MFSNMNDPNYTTIEAECLDCHGTGKDEDQLRCPTCDGRGYLTKDKLWRGPLDNGTRKRSEEDEE